MSVVFSIKSVTAESMNTLYGTHILPATVLVNLTKPEFEGDYTVVLFAFTKELKIQLEVLGQELGTYLTTHYSSLFTGFTVVKGFLNLSISHQYWFTFLAQNFQNPNFGKSPHTSNCVMVEYSSPNTNKPLHLGHLRNNFLGRSIAEILKATGNKVVKTCIVNDRGIHICKSMIAWQRYANGETPNSTHTKGDHFVGDYYVKFNEAYKVEIELLKAGGMLEEAAEKQAPIMQEAQQMLLEWEAGKPDVVDLWKIMNEWVYEGFKTTYKTIGTDFDKIYYESNTYLLGKDLVEKGLEAEVFYQKEDSSVWIDLTPDGLDEKLVRRKDGTSVYMTQDIGLAEQKQKEFNASKSIYVVGDEQNYHFKVLKLICQKLKLPSADGIYHLSYGMVELPSGKMKSREGTVVDADDLVAEMINIARKKTEELGKVNDFTKIEREELYETIGLGALKFFLLRVDPKKKMVFNPEESIDFHGFTGPFIQYTHARIKSILRKIAQESTNGVPNSDCPLFPLEKQLIIELEQFPAVMEEAATENDPSKIAIYTFNLAKTFSSFYSEHSIANAESEEKKALRIMLAKLTAGVIKTGMELLGIKVPERM
ncbi:MAG: arginine--tRNA ligase [Sphingobacteriia bacterium]|nr:MAG: arginine--tRNA ligase [Sphingobacteriia bacterium]